MYGYRKKWLVLIFALIPIVAYPQSASQISSDISATLKPDDPEIRLIADLSAKKLHVYHNSLLSNTYDIAIGEEEHPTPTGEYFITQIDWNPEWVPPHSEWAEGRSYKRPGHPENPLGLMRMHFHEEYKIHGTLEHWSIGRRISRGCIRLTNTDILQIARTILRATEVKNYQAYFAEAEAHPFRMIDLELSRPVAFSVYSQLNFVPDRWFDPKPATNMVSRRDIQTESISSTFRDSPVSIADKLLLTDETDNQEQEQKL